MKTPLLRVFGSGGTGALKQGVTVVSQGLLTFSFDDGREDNYRVAFPILARHGLTATINVTSGWIDGTWTPNPTWRSMVGGPMTVDQLGDLHDGGWEIAAHGDRHRNDRNDVARGIDKLRAWGFPVYGFASPHYRLTSEKVPEFRSWLEPLGIQYARGGWAHVPVVSRLFRKDLGLSTLKPMALQMHPNNNMTRLPDDGYRLTCQIVRPRSTVDDIVQVVTAAMDQDAWCILCLHSVLHRGDRAYGADGCTWDAQLLDELCSWVSRQINDGLKVVTTVEGVRFMRR